MPPSDERVVGVVAEEKGGSGIWEGGGVVVRWPAEPMQQEVNGCRKSKAEECGKQRKNIRQQKYFRNCKI